MSPIAAASAFGTCWSRLAVIRDSEVRSEKRFGPELRIEETSQPDRFANEFLHCLRFGSEVDDAGAKSESSVDDGVRWEHLAAELDVEHQALVEPVEVLVGIGTFGEAIGHEAETRDGQPGVRHRLELRVLDDELVEIAGQGDVLEDSPLVCIPPVGEK